jgi:multiple sugar transport system ATP-binding protein
MASVTFSDLHKSFGKTKILHGISLEIADGEFMVLVGPSGCGKSTLLRMLAGLEDIGSGSIAIDGRVVNDVDSKDRDIAMVFQSYALYPHMTVRENMGFSLRLRNEDRKLTAQRVEKASTILNLQPYLDRYPRELSGGQRQRVAIARVLAAEPLLVILDEAVAALDVSIQAQVLNLLADIRDATGVSYILISHDLAVVRQLCEQVIVMHRGVVVERGATADVLDAPQHTYTQLLRDSVPGPGWKPRRRVDVASA